MSDDLTLVEILGEEDASLPPGCVHDVIAARLSSIIGPDRSSGRFDLHLKDDPVWVAEMLRAHAGRVIGAGATWIRFVDPVAQTGLLAVVHCPNPLGEAEMILVSDGRMLTRNVIRDLCSWAFLGLGLLRIVVRTHAQDTVTADYVRRVGFDFEGTARDFFSQGYDASVWGMSIWRCRWLSLSKVPPPQMAIPAADISPPSSIARH